MSLVRRLDVTNAQVVKVNVRSATTFSLLFQPDSYDFDKFITFKALVLFQTKSRSIPAAINITSTKSKCEAS